MEFKIGDEVVVSHHTSNFYKKEFIITGFEPDNKIAFLRNKDHERVRLFVSKLKQINKGLNPKGILRRALSIPEE